MADIVFRGSKDDLRRALRRLPGIVAGRVPDPTGLVRSLQLRIGVAALSQVEQDFIVKARGGTGRDGVKWLPLKPATIARRRRTRDDKRRAAAAIRGAKQAGLKRPTVIELYGSRQVEILRDTSKMFRSLSPGVEDRPSGAADQIFRMDPGQVIVGTNVPYATTHQHGLPEKNVPARPMWPTDGTIPPAWLPAIVGAARRGVVRIIIELLRTGSRRPR